MANSSANVGVGKPKINGAIWTAVPGAQLPTTTTDDLSALGYTCLGYGGDAGLKESRSKSTEKIKAWGGDVVRVTSSEYEEKYQMTLIETNVAVLKEVYGQDNVEVDSSTGRIKVYSTSQDLANRIWVFDIALTDTMNERIVVPLGNITEFEDIEYKDDSAVGYGITVNAYPSEESGKSSNSYNIVEASHYTVRFDTQGHGKTPGAVQVAAGGKVTEPTEPTAEGYTFGGWFKEAACTNEWTFSTDVVTSNMTLYAKWTASSNKSKN